MRPERPGEALWVGSVAVAGLYFPDRFLDVSGSVHIADLTEKFDFDEGAISERQHLLLEGSKRQDTRLEQSEVHWLRACAPVRQGKDGAA